MDISIEFQIERLAKRLGTIQHQIIPMAASSAMNSAVSKGNTQAKKQIMAQVGLPQRVFAKHFKTYKASKKGLKARLWVGFKYGKKMSALTQSQRKKQWAKYGVLSQPFRATMPTGHTSQFVRVTQTGSSKGSNGRSKDPRQKKGVRPDTSPRNLPIVDVENTKVRIPDALAARVVRGLRPFVMKEFRTRFHREVRNRLRRLRSR